MSQINEDKTLDKKISDMLREKSEDFISSVFTTSNAVRKQDSLTLDALNEAIELIRALAPKEAPRDMFLINGKALKIVKNEMLPEDTIIVSKRLFDLIYSSE